MLALENGQPIARTVQVGLNDGKNVQVVSGITPGQTVVTGTGSVRAGAAGASSGRGGAVLGGPGL